MQTANRSKSFICRILICCLYVLFFAVQLHLKYSFPPVPQDGSEALISSVAGKQIHKLSIERDNDKSVSSTVRLNKRYFPGYSLMVEPAEVPANSYVFISPDYFISGSKYLIHSFLGMECQRGPPFTC